MWRLVSELNTPDEIGVILALHALKRQNKARDKGVLWSRVPLTKEEKRAAKQREALIEERIPTPDTHARIVYDDLPTYPNRIGFWKLAAFYGLSRDKRNREVQNLGSTLSVLEKKGLAKHITREYRNGKLVRVRGLWSRLIPSIEAGKMSPLWDRRIARA